MKKSRFISRILTLLVSLSIAVTSFSVALSAATPNTTWFVQGSSTSGTTWESTNLNKLFFPNMSDATSAEMPMYSTKTGVSGHINKWGCSVSAVAMILRNMDAKTSESKQDIRTGTTGKLTADPFTVTMSNIGWPTVVKDGDKYIIDSYTSSNSPVYPSKWATIAQSFDKTGHRVDLNGLTTEQKADTLAYYISKHPEGIFVRVANSHSVVFTKSTHPAPATLNGLGIPEPILLTCENELEISRRIWLEEQNAIIPFAISSTSYDSKFTCYDPATKNEEKAKGVTYDNSWCAEKYGGIDKVNYIIYFD